MAKKKEPTRPSVNSTPKSNAAAVEKTATIAPLVLKPATAPVTAAVTTAPTIVKSVEKVEVKVTPATVEKPTPASTAPIPPAVAPEKPVAPTPVLTPAPTPKPVETTEPAPSAAKSATPGAKAPTATTNKSAAKSSALTKAERAALAKPASTALAPATIVVAKYDVGHGNSLFIRGEGAGLNWESGVEMTNADSDVWVWTTQQIAEGFIMFKFLINDEIWSAGENMSAAAGETTTLTPSFS